jgi:hypothetical protein
VAWRVGFCAGAGPFGPPAGGTLDHPRMAFYLRQRLAAGRAG